MKIFSILLGILLFPSLFPGIEKLEASQLKNSLYKYKNSTVSEQTLKRLSPYNAFINYYSRFSFFRKNYRVSPDFIRALIIAESGVNPTAVSSKGAMGLGQIMYSTGKQAARELAESGYTFRYINPQKLSHLQNEDLFDPAVNILLTCYLISKYNYKFNGRLELVLSAWNAGEYHEDLKKGIPPPYQETHNLIGRINAYYIDLLKKRKQISVYSRP